MEKITLAVQQRSDSDRTQHLRQLKIIPAVVYGYGFKNLHLKIDYQTFRRVFEQATFSTIVHLDVDGNKQVPVLVHDVQYNPVNDEIVHVDFYAVRMDQRVTTHIALEFIGISEAVKLGAVLNTFKYEVEVSCLPGDLVHNITVDLSILKELNDIIRVSDIVPPQGIEILDQVDEPIISAIEPKIIEEEPLETIEGAEGEISEIEEGKEAEESVEDESKESKNEE